MSGNIYDSTRRTLPESNPESVYFDFFSPAMVSAIGRDVSARLYARLGAPVRVPESTVRSVMDAVYQSEKRDPDVMARMVTAYLVDYVATELDQISQNNRLNVWITQYLPESGMRRTPKLKLREKRPTPFLFRDTY